jgi:hypothetical protein
LRSKIIGGLQGFSNFPGRSFAGTFRVKNVQMEKDSMGNILKHHWRILQPCYRFCHVNITAYQSSQEVEFHAI